MWNHLKEKLKSIPSFLKQSIFLYYAIAIAFLLVLMLVLSFTANIGLGFLMLVIFTIGFVLMYRFSDLFIRKLNQYVIELSDTIRSGEQDAYLKMPIGMILYDAQERVQWINPYLQNYFPNSNMIGLPIREINEKMYFQMKKTNTASQNEQMINWQNRQFRMVIHSNIRMIYLMDITKYATLENRYLHEQPVFGQIFLDNFDEISQSLNDRRKSNLNNFVTNQLTNWAQHYNVYLKRVDDDRFIAFLNRACLDELEKSKFDIIDRIRENTAKQNYPLTISMGFSYHDNTKDDIQYHEIAAYAQANLDLALGRGGDQVVVRAQNEDARFYGGKTNPMEKRTRVRARMVSQALDDLMREADKVIVMGHQFPDMDSIGACLGIRRIAKMNGKKAWIVTNTEQFSHDIKKLMDEIKKDKEIAADIIPPVLAEQLITPDTLVILVDVSRPMITAAPTLLEKDSKLVVIDHHRRGQEFPKKPVLVYIEPYASSTGELITELFEYQKNEANSIQAIEATAMLGGIIVDTRNFTLRTGSRTFDAASYLKSVGADTILIQRLLKENVETYLLRSHLLNTLIMLPNNIGIVHGEEEVPYPTVVAAQTADMMLSMENIDASFVVTKREDGRVGISARSLGNKNVQRVMEELGGGGHLSNAATQLSNISVILAVEQLKEVILSLENEIDL